jgi:hypothetical protein
MTATPDMTGWMQMFQGREPLPVRVTAVEGDSIMFEVGPYESVLRPGVQVSTQSVARLQDGRLVGTTMARYQTAAADSTLRVTFEATRSQ